MQRIIIPLAGLLLAGAVALPVFAAETLPSSPAKSEAPPSKPSPEVMPAAPGASGRPVSVFTARQENAARIAYVDMNRVATDSVPGKAAASEMKSRAARIRSQIESKQKRLEKQKAELEAKMPTLPPNQRVAKAKEFQKKVEEFQKYVQNSQKDLQAKEGALLEKLYKSIGRAAADYGKARGFAAITAKKDLLYIGENVEMRDITDDIVTMVNAEKGMK